jgi:hypothetical protein
MVGTDEKTGKEIWAPYIVWGTDHVKVTAAEAIQADAGGRGAVSAKREAREFLLDRLEAGPVRADDLLEEAEQNGISQKTLRRAKQELQISSRKESKLPDGGWFWELPPKPKSKASALLVKRLRLPRQKANDGRVLVSVDP